MADREKMSQEPLPKRHPGAMVKRVVWTEQPKADVRGMEQPIALQILKTPARYAQTG